MIRMNAVMVQKIIQMNSNIKFSSQPKRYYSLNNVYSWKRESRSHSCEPKLLAKRKIPLLVSVILLASSGMDQKRGRVFRSQGLL